MLRANKVAPESGPSGTLQGLIKPSHIPGFWADPRISQVEGNNQPPHSFQQPLQDKDTPLQLRSPGSEQVSVHLGWQDHLRPHSKLRSILSPSFLHPPAFLSWGSAFLPWGSGR